MATENTAVETQADENTENENTIAEENQKKIEEEVDNSGDEAKETEKDIPIKISETETLNLKYYLKTDKKDKFFVGVSQLSGKDNPLSMPLSSLAKIISTNPYLQNSLSTINVTPNELFVSFDKPLPDDDKSKHKWLVGGDVTLASTKDLSLFLNGNLKNASFEGESFFVLATGGFTKKQTKSINQRLSEDNNKIIIPSNADKDDAVAGATHLKLS